MLGIFCDGDRFGYLLVASEANDYKQCFGEPLLDDIGGNSRGYDLLEGDESSLAGQD